MTGAGNRLSEGEIRGKRERTRGVIGRNGRKREGFSAYFPCVYRESSTNLLRLVSYGLSQGAT